MWVGLLFYIPEHNETQIGNSEVSASSGGETLVVVVIVIIIVVVIIVLVGIWDISRQRSHQSEWVSIRAP